MPTQGHLTEPTLHHQRETSHGHDRTHQHREAASPRPAKSASCSTSSGSSNIQVVDVKFCDLPGTWQHFSIPAATLDEEMIREGLGFDGSSIRGFQAINESDMLLLPDVSTAFVDPVLDGADALAHLRHLRPAHARAVLARPAVHRLQGRGVPPDHRHRHHVVLGPRGGVLHLQLGAVRPERPRGLLPHRLGRGRVELGPERRQPNLGHRPRHKEGYFPVPPADRLQDVRSKIMLALIEAGVPVEVQHHEVATAGQAEIDFKFGTLVQTADRLMAYKYVVKNVCHNLGYTATFMPKPLFGDNGSGMHVHQSLWKGDTPLFYDENGYALLSETARHYIGGLIAHAPALLALCAPTTNSYRRLVPGFEAPVNLMYSARNRSAICRIPMLLEQPQGPAGRVPGARSDGQPVPGLLRAAHGGPRRDPAQARAARADRRGPVRAARRAEAASSRRCPARWPKRWPRWRPTTTSCSPGDVFTPDVLETWITMKRTKDIAPVSLRPHPYEFFLYYDA